MMSHLLKALLAIEAEESAVDGKGIASLLRISRDKNSFFESSGLQLPPLTSVLTAR